MRRIQFTKIAMNLLLVAALPMAAGAQQMEAHIGNVTGHAAAGKALYYRYCWGCHGARGNGDGENAPYLNILPRNFVAGTFNCRDTPAGTLALGHRAYNSGA